MLGYHEGDGLDNIINMIIYISRNCGKFVIKLNTMELIGVIMLLELFGEDIFIII